jgi:hypothetical protein
MTLNISAFKSFKSTVHTSVIQISLLFAAKQDLETGHYSSDSSFITSFHIPFDATGVRQLFHRQKIDKKLNSIYGSGFNNRLEYTRTTHRSCVTYSYYAQVLCYILVLRTGPVLHTRTTHRSCVTYSYYAQVLCHIHILRTRPVWHTPITHTSAVTYSYSSHVLCYIHSYYAQVLCYILILRTGPVSHSHTTHRSCVTYLCSATTLLLSFLSFLLKRSKFSHDCFQSMSELHTVCLLRRLFADILAVSFPVHSVWGLWCTERWNRLFSEYFRLTLCHHLSTSAPYPFYSSAVDCVWRYLIQGVHFFRSQHDGFSRKVYRLGNANPPVIWSPYSFCSSS